VVKPLLEESNNVGLIIEMDASIHEESVGDPGIQRVWWSFIDREEGDL
jgi:hypothetical protein